MTTQPTDAALAAAFREIRGAVGESAEVCIAIDRRARELDAQYQPNINSGDVDNGDAEKAAEVVAWEVDYCGHHRMVQFDKPPSGGEMDKVFSNPRPLVYATPPAQAAESRANAARDFPANTCPASRHVQLIAEAIKAGTFKPGPWMADSLFTVVAELWELRQPPAQAAEAVERVASEDAHAMNTQLCGFGLRWRVDGDYMRCKKCDRPQLASCARLAFKHESGCKNGLGAERHPWLEFLRITTPINRAAIAAMRAGEG